MNAVPVISTLATVVNVAGVTHATPIATASVEDIIKVSRMGHLLASQIVAFSSLMLEANMTVLCSALVVFGSPRYCDCVQCLNTETDFRQKYCRFGELVRSSERVRKIHDEVMEISGADDFYRAYCDSRRCPSIPQRCCSNTKERIRVATNYCPRCLPVDHRYRSTCAT